MTPKDKQELISGIQQVLEPRFGELSEAIHDLATHMDERFQQNDDHFARIERSITATRDYLDRKIEDVWGNTVALVRKELRA